ncbi:purine-nucleoside phosphorylase [Kocuria sp.]|uniref:purine-nucleoside phosphorylase n=1 Tax=Kocuria sp. TaxID=1871328 RepID=UPI0026E0E30D|nr:purine-nucleoside phosphorylase [Kocuria sp.]MDO5618057.1 purine-nucleoside phosphorylase [Kocuria sp.]
MIDTAGKSTPHIQPDGVPIAETILLPGDPLRAKFIAENYLENTQQFNRVRGMLGFTGMYRGREVSVMGTGMGMPSMGIYSWELINVFGVKNLIRVGSCGALQDELNLYDVVLAQGASTDSNYASQYQLPGTYAPLASYGLLEQAKRAADDLGVRTHVGGVVSSDVFYNANDQVNGRWAAMGLLAVEMEAAALYMNAAAAGVNALALFTVSDHIMRAEETTPQERQTAFTQMMEIALTLA